MSSPLTDGYSADQMIPQYIPGLPGLTQARLVNGASDLKPFEYLRNEGGRYYAQNALTNPEEGGAALPPPVQPPPQQFNPGAPSVSLPPPSPPPGGGPMPLPGPPNTMAGPSPMEGMSSPAVMPPGYGQGFNPFKMGMWGGLPRPYGGGGFGGRMRRDVAQSNMGMNAMSQGATPRPMMFPPQTGGGDPMVEPGGPLPNPGQMSGGYPDGTPAGGYTSIRPGGPQMPGGFGSFFPSWFGAGLPQPR